MKRIVFILITSVILMVSFTGGHMSHAQTPFKFNIDTDIHTIRNLQIPTFRYHYDDYLQYAPVMLTVGMKTYGIDGRSASWSRMLVSDAFSVAVMAATVNGIKYSIGRLRPDGSAYNSFPSGHTATAFMSATMLHMEYGWKNPWYSIGGYTAAAVTGVSRIMNNRHWLTDVLAGAAIGIGSVHLGYYITDRIFGDRGFNKKYRKPEFHYDSDEKHYVAELIFGRRFIVGDRSMQKPVRGGFAGVQADIPVIPGAGVAVRASVSSMTFASSLAYDMPALAMGGYWNHTFLDVLEFQAKGMAGPAWGPEGTRLDLCAETGLSLILDNSFRLKIFTGWESFNNSVTKSWLHTIVLGYGASWYW